MVARAVYRRPSGIIAPCRAAISSGNIVMLSVGDDWFYNPLNRKWVHLPSLAGLAATGLTPGTLYNIYLDTIAAALLADTTAFATTGGVRHFTGDTSKLLVAGAIPITGPAWVSDATRGNLASLFNPQRKTLLIQEAAQASTSSANAWITPSGADLLLTCVQHPDHAVEMMASITIQGASASAVTSIGIDVGLTGTPNAASVVDADQNPQTGTVTRGNGVSRYDSSPPGVFSPLSARVRVRASAGNVVLFANGAFRASMFA